MPVPQRGFRRVGIPTPSKLAASSTVSTTNRLSRMWAFSAATPTGGALSGSPSTTSSLPRCAPSHFYGDDFKVEFPTGSRDLKTLEEVAGHLSHRLTHIFLRDEQGHRAVHGDVEKFQQDPNWRDLLLFYEYFHGDNGAGLGASHQTGWTGLIANLLFESGEYGGDLLRFVVNDVKGR